MFERFFGKKKSSSVAKDRLKLVLIHDRRLISNVVLNDIKDDIMVTLSKYLKVDQEGLDIQFDVETENRNKGALIVSVPVKEIIKK